MLTAGSKMGEELSVDKLIEKYFLELTRGTKNPATGNPYICRYYLKFNAPTVASFLVLPKFKEEH